MLDKRIEVIAGNNDPPQLFISGDGGTIYIQAQHSIQLELPKGWFVDSLGRIRLGTKTSGGLDLPWFEVTGETVKIEDALGDPVTEIPLEWLVAAVDKLEAYAAS